MAGILKRLRGGAAGSRLPAGTGDGIRVEIDPAAFVEALYTEILGRRPDSAEVAGWAARLSAGMAPGEVVKAFMESEEMRGRYLLRESLAGRIELDAPGFVEALYAHLFGRLPEPAEVAGYSARLGAGTAPGELLKEFLDSEETRGRYLLRESLAGRIELDAAAFVEALYAHLFGRLPDPAEVAGYSARLGAGTAPGELLKEFLDSEETRGRYLLRESLAGRIEIDAAGFVEALYAHLFGRLPEPAEVAGYSARLGAGTAPGELLKEFLDSEETRGRYILKDPGKPRILVDPAALIETLYTRLLGRSSMPEERDALTARLAAGTDPDALVKEIVESDEARGRCLGLRGFVPAGHYYSPVVDPAAIAGRFRSRAIPGQVSAISVTRERHEALWRDFAPRFAEMPFTPLPREGLRYHFENPSFTYGDGLLYYSMLRRIRPRRVIEIGSGYTSALLLDVAERFLEEKPRCTFIEPYPDLIRNLLSDSDLERNRLLASPVQEVPVELFRTLQDGDILFIDSSHVLKTCSDTHYELFEILPVLNPGVHVHVHDIFWPFEYLEEWVLDDNRSWNEAYALRAFLMYNQEFEVTFFNDYFGRFCRDLIEKDMPLWGRNTGGSIWLRKKAPGAA